ncbi:PREDICTED: neuronal pentraxin-1-like [Priapulus caudatus]|uniref:Neuronal pentraxin-1-like n=1 Tax=Priapulus caudatus TaxID=37621 RepID=A0ABM1E936_PRICU|nr:PREDICTED: neuronal pentraxin-1-like [Priapulus caudatus]
MTNIQRSLTAATVAFIAMLHATRASFDLGWTTKDTESYAIFPAAIPELSELSVCFWMRTTDWDSELVVLSYATPDNDNEIVIYLPGEDKIRFYVAGQYKEAVANVRDGRFHQICMIWRKQLGNWAIYIDASRASAGIGLSSGVTIKDDGVLVIGQEQDELAGDFDYNQAYIGELSDLNVFNRSLTDNEVNVMSRTCYYDGGNVLRWYDVRGGLRGNPKFYSPTACQGFDGEMINRNAAPVRTKSFLASDHYNRNGGAI